MSILTTLQSELTDLKPVSASCVEVEVQFEEGALMHSLAEELYSEFERMSPYADYQPIRNLTSDDILKYLCTLLWMRVSDVNRATDKTWALYRPSVRAYAVPVLFYQILAGIGICYDRDFNLMFIPAYTISQDKLLSPEEMKSLSRLFRQFEDSGMKVVFGIPKSQDGELDFMAMSHVTAEVTSYRKSHPVYGFLASFVAEQQLNEVTGQMSRIVYGHDTDYKARLGALIRAINKADLSHDKV